jgi:hypothetical protein
LVVAVNAAEGISTNVQTGFVGVTYTIEVVVIPVKFEPVLIAAEAVPDTKEQSKNRFSEYGTWKVLEVHDAVSTTAPGT